MMDFNWQDCTRVLYAKYSSAKYKYIQFTFFNSKEEKSCLCWKIYLTRKESNLRFLECYPTLSAKWAAHSGWLKRVIFRNWIQVDSCCESRSEVRFLLWLLRVEKDSRVTPRYSKVLIRKISLHKDIWLWKKVCLLSISEIEIDFLKTFRFSVRVYCNRSQMTS